MKTHFFIRLAINFNSYIAWSRLSSLSIVLGSERSSGLEVYFTDCLSKGLYPQLQAYQRCQQVVVVIASLGDLDIIMQSVCKVASCMYCCTYVYYYM